MVVLVQLAKVISPTTRRAKFLKNVFISVSITHSKIYEAKVKKNRFSTLFSHTLPLKQKEN